MSRHYKTGTVARQLGIAPPLLRAWQARYNFVEPTRGPGGQRLYTDEDVALLRAARLLIGRGHTIGELAAWPSKDLLRAARAVEQQGRTVAESDVPTAEACAGAGDLRDAVIFTLERDGRIAIVSPNVEAVLGWPYGLLVGQPLWGLLIDVPPLFSRLVEGTGETTPAHDFVVWMRRRSGAAVPCRIACGTPRRGGAGTSITLSVWRLGSTDDDPLTRLVETLEQAQLGPEPASAEQLCQQWARRVTEQQSAALARAWRYQEEDGTLRLVASAGLSKAVATSSRAVIRLASYPYKVAAVARTGIPFVHNGVEGDRDFDQGFVEREHIESAAVLPLGSGGVLAGVALAFFRCRLTPDAIGRLQAGAAVLGAALATLRRAAGEPLTDPGRPALETGAQPSRRQGKTKK